MPIPHCNCNFFCLTQSLYVFFFQEPFPPSQMKESILNDQEQLSLENDQLQAKIKELATATEKLAQKDVELQQKVKELSNMSEILQKKDNELAELKLSAAEISKVKSELDQANDKISALGKTNC